MVQLMDTGHYSCPALVDGRCSVYDDRPMICRLYGTVEVMRCPYGCVPKGGFLPHEVGTRLVRESLRVGGGER